MSINKLISYKNVLLDLLDDLALDHTKYTPMFARWIEKAEKKIGSRYQYKKKIAVLNIKGCTAELPNDAAYVQRGIMGNQGCDCQDLFLNVGGSIASKAVSISSSANAAYNNLSFLIVDIVPAGQFTDASNFYYIDYEIQGNKIIFKQNYNGSQITIQYLGIETDCDGLMLIGENHVDAITWYCKWKFYDRRIRSGIDLGKVRDYKMEWERQCLNARAVDATQTEPERQATLQYIHDPYVGWGLRLQPTLGTWGSVMNGVW